MTNKKIIEEVLKKWERKINHQILFQIMTGKDKGRTINGQQIINDLKEPLRITLINLKEKIEKKKDKEFEKAIDEFYNEFVLHCFCRKDWNLFIKLWNKYLGKYCTCNQKIIKKIKELKSKGRKNGKKKTNSLE